MDNAPKAFFEVFDPRETMKHLVGHLEKITLQIGERNIFRPEKLGITAEYIAEAQKQNGLEVESESFMCEGITATNVIAWSNPNGTGAEKRYLLGAHYDCFLGTVGADDNTSAIAVQLETARLLQKMRAVMDIPISVKFVSFSMEEYPAYSTRMGSRVHAGGMKARNEKTDGMICLEMVGYTCSRPGCQKYPFPISRMGFPERGDYIAVVGNFGSGRFARKLLDSFRGNPNLPVVSLSVPLNGWILPAVRFSDHSSFWDEGFPAVMVTDGAFFRNPNYHLPTDTMETLDFEFMARLVESLMVFFLSPSF